MRESKRIRWACLAMLLELVFVSSFQASRPFVRRERVAGGVATATESSETEEATRGPTSAIRPSLLELQQQQQRAAAIASSFSTRDDFAPLFTNGHLQTILPFFLRDHCSYIPRDNPFGTLVRIGRGIMKKVDAKKRENVLDNDDLFFWDKRERIETPDGDWFHADTKYCNGQRRRDDDDVTTPTVILMHGLQSNSNSSLSTELARAFNKQGMHCVCLNFRGCSGITNQNFGGYHLGFTDDLIQYVELFRQRQRRCGSSAPLFLAGFSLGANVVLKALGGELAGEKALEYGIKGAAVSCPPFDLTKNFPILARPGSIHRLVYSNSLLESMKDRLSQQWEQLYDIYPNVNIDYEGAMAAETIMEYEDAVIAPLYGFENFMDYYKKTSCIHFLEGITVPTFIVNAADDPFMEPSVWPVEKTCENGGKAPIKMIRTRHGGHLGYGFHQVEEGDERLRGNGIFDDDDDDDDEEGPWPSWASWELARFLDHVHKHDKTEQVLKE